jgi:hypothetical protein
VTASFFGATFTSLILSRIAEQPLVKAELLTVMLPRSTSCHSALFWDHTLCEQSVGDDVDKGVERDTR